MDKVDKRILDILQSNSQISNQDLAEEISLSPSPCLRRVKQLEKDGYIKKNVAILDKTLLNLNLTVFVLVVMKVHSTKSMDDFMGLVEHIPHIVECHVITGQDADIMLKVVVPDMNYYNNFLFNNLLNIDSIENVISSFVLRSYEDKTSLPLDHIK
jgi:Lrp/AsnC family transcriptional regulator, leucine-responsive regulatory protein